MKKMLAVIFLKRSGAKYDSYGQELNYGYSKGLDSYKDSIQEQHSSMEFWKPAYIMKDTPSVQKEVLLYRKERKRIHRVNNITEALVEANQKVIALGVKDLDVYFLNVHRKRKLMVPL